MGVKQISSFLAQFVDELLDFIDLRRHYPANYLWFDSRILLPRDERLESFLLEVPSQTSPRERMYLYNFFRFQYKGGRVIEVGPFLGGTTRAIAMGMLDSGIQVEPRSLLTIDEFDGYKTYNSILEMGVPAEKISENIPEDPNSRINFSQIFNAYNDNNAYTHIVEALAFKIPEFSKRTCDLDSLDKIRRFCNEKTELECIFVDGAKSYHALYFILTELANSIREGTTLIFQDYLKISCWWIPLIVGVLEDYFEVTSIVDSTVTLVCIKDLLDKANVLEHLPPEVRMLSSSQIGFAFASRISQTVSSYSKKNRAINLVQEIACLSDVELPKSVKDFDFWKTSISLFPRAFFFFRESRNSLKGEYNQR